MKICIVNKVFNKKNQLVSFDIVDIDTGELITPKFDAFTTYEDYIKSGVEWVEPMTAKEFLNEAELELMLTSNDYYAEEKLDGTRATIHFFEEHSRIFSRRISKDTGWFCENTDSLPHLREISIPSLKGTVIDGEMRIDGKEFKEVASTLNCKWNKAILRQTELGFITIHAFDIVYYKGIYIAKMPLWKRKQYLEKVIEEVGSEYIKSEFYTLDNTVKTITDRMIRDYLSGKLSVEAYPNLFSTIRSNLPFIEADFDKYDAMGCDFDFDIEIDKRTLYEYITYTGGEGIMLKHKDGKYYHKRGREYTKWKKFLTRDCIIIDFSDPTKEYEGKLPETWEYWEGDIAVSKFYALQWVGNIKFGVIITPEELAEYKKKNKGKSVIVHENFYVGQNKHTVLEVGECSGFDEEQRKEFSDRREQYIGTTVEILCNELFTDTGKMRHPRFLRLREDKNPQDCIWNDHIGG